MAAKSKSSSAQHSQHKAFIAAARAAECDEDPAAFDAKMRKLVKVKVATPQPKSRRRQKVG